MSQSEAGAGSLDREWDAFVAAARHGYHEQCSAYGAIRSQSGFACSRVVVRRAEQIAGGAQILTQRTPVGRYARLFRGPLALDDEPAVLSEVVAALEQHVRQEGIASLRVDLFPTQIEAGNALRAAGFTPSRAWFGDLRASSVRLDRTDEELLADMPRDARRCLRVAERFGVEVRRDAETSTEEFFALRHATAEHAGYKIYPLKYYRAVCSLFGAAGRLHVHTAFLGEKPVGALVGCRAGNRMYFMWMGTHRGEHERRAMGNHLLYLEAIRHARGIGCTHCDCLGNTPFTRKLMPEEIEWPAPMRKCYGPLGFARRAAIERIWQVPSVRGRIDRLAKHLGLRPRMAY